MNVHSSLLGLYQPQDGWLFRLAPGWKYLILLAITIPALVVWQWWFTLLSLALTLVILKSSGISFRRSLEIGWMLWVLLAILAGYQLITLSFANAITSPGNVLVAVLAARILTLTSSTPELLDALGRGLGFLRPLGVDSDKVALAVAVMVRSIPYLMGSLADARDAARARGIERNVVALLIPTMVGAVAYAQRTGESLDARGLADSPDHPEGGGQGRRSG